MSIILSWDEYIASESAKNFRRSEGLLKSSIRNLQTEEQLSKKKIKQVFAQARESLLNSLMGTPKKAWQNALVYLHDTREEIFSTFRGLQEDHLTLNYPETASIPGITPNEELRTAATTGLWKLALKQSDPDNVVKLPVSEQPFLTKRRRRPKGSHLAPNPLHHPACKDIEALSKEIDAEWNRPAPIAKSYSSVVADIEKRIFDKLLDDTVLELNRVWEKKEHSQ